MQEAPLFSLFGILVCLKPKALKMRTKVAELVIFIVTVLISAGFAFYFYRDTVTTSQKVDEEIKKDSCWLNDMPDFLLRFQSPAQGNPYGGGFGLQILVGWI